MNIPCVISINSICLKRKSIRLIRSLWYWTWDAHRNCWAKPPRQGHTAKDKFVSEYVPSLDYLSGRLNFSTLSHMCCSNPWCNFTFLPSFLFSFTNPQNMQSLHYRNRFWSLACWQCIWRGRPTSWCVLETKPKASTDKRRRRRTEE